jgi:hypothetical protein
MLVSLFEYVYLVILVHGYFFFALWDELRDGGLRPMDAEQLREHAHKMVDFIADYYKSIEDFPVLSQVEVLTLSLSVCACVRLRFFLYVHMGMNLL